MGAVGDAAAPRDGDLLNRVEPSVEASDKSGQSATSLSCAAPTGRLSLPPASLRDSTCPHHTCESLQLGWGQSPFPPECHLQSQNVGVESQVMSTRDPRQRAYHFRRDMATGRRLRRLTGAILHVWGQIFNDKMMIAYIIREPFQRPFHRCKI